MCSLNLIYKAFLWKLLDGQQVIQTREKSKFHIEERFVRGYQVTGFEPSVVILFFFPPTRITDFSSTTAAPLPNSCYNEVKIKKMELSLRIVYAQGSMITFRKNRIRTVCTTSYILFHSSESLISYTSVKLNTRKRHQRCE